VGELLAAQVPAPAVEVPVEPWPDNDPEPAAPAPAPAPEVVHTTDNLPQPLPEAPSSANVRIQLHGYEVQVTLRDHSGPSGAKSRFFTVRERLLSLSKRIMCRIT
jgi:hypothetical protein